MIKILKPCSIQFALFALLLSAASAQAQKEEKSLTPNTAAKAKTLVSDTATTSKTSGLDAVPPPSKTLAPDAVITPRTSGYIAKNESIQSLFNALSSETKKPFVLSKLAQKKTITGDFDISNPYRFLDKFSTQIGLAWYDDGQTIYVYDNSELKNSVVLMRYASLTSLNEFLQRTGLISKRYPIRGEHGTGAFYVAGPPVYVDLVLNAATYLDDLYKNVDLNKQKIKVIKLQHTIVGDRTFKVRDQEIKVVGIGKVIEAILSNEFKELVTVTNEPGTKMGFDKNVTQVGKAALPVSLPEKQVVNEKSQIKVIAYPGTNSLLVKGSQGQIELIENLITQLDVPKRHIELSLWIIDITKTALDQLGIDWTGGINIGSRGAVSLNTSTVNATRFLAQITALNKQDVAQIVSRPIILTQDNVPSVFDTNQTFYTKLQSERVANLESVTYGTIIEVLPRYSTAGEEIEMVLDIEDGSQAVPGFGTASAVDGLPVITRTTISTVARVPKDKSLLIGGVTRDNYSSTNKKIPFLGDLPFIGTAFRSTSETVTKTVRIYLIQPKLLALSSIWDAEGFTAPPMLAPETPLSDTIQELSAYPGAHDARH